MFSHLFLGIRKFPYASGRRLEVGMRSLVASVVACGASAAPAEPVLYAGALAFEPGASALSAAQRQTLDPLTMRRPGPACVGIAVSRPGGPVIELNALELRRRDYVARLFALRGVTVVHTAIRWPSPGEAITPAWGDVVIWVEGRCPDTAPPELAGANPTP